MRIMSSVVTAQRVSFVRDETVEQSELLLRIHLEKMPWSDRISCVLCPVYTQPLFLNTLHHTG